MDAEWGTIGSSVRARVAIVATCMVAAVAVGLGLLAGRVAEAQSEEPPGPEDFQKVVLAQGTELGEVGELTVAPDGRVFFINRAGDIMVYRPETKTVEVMINNPTLGVWSGLEDGGLGITVDPDFEENRWIYVYYSPLPEDANKQRLSRFTVEGNRIEKSSERVLLEIPTQRNRCCHSAGSLAFGPDGLLYLSTGDNTSSSDNGGYSPHDEREGRSDFDAQKSSANTNDLRGKIVRIDPRADAGGEVDVVPGDDASYDIPEGNLFGPGGKYPDVDPGKVRPEIYAMGLRNPYRIGIDHETGWLYWGEVGPDSRTNDPNRGPRHHEEFNRAKEAMNGGWPYCVGYVGEDLTNQDFGGAYVDWDFAADTYKTNPDGSPKRFPCNDPEGMKGVNDSPNSTGLRDLPPMTNPLIPYSDVGPYMYPEVQGATPTGGQVYRQSRVVWPSENSFPAYYEGSYFISEMSRGWIKEVRFDEQGEIESINDFMSGLQGPIDMEFGPDGSMYVLEYGTSFFSGSPDTKLVRIDYVKNGRVPEVEVGADRTEGGVPLTVNFTSEGTRDGDGDELSYEWDFGDGATSAEQNPTHTYEEPGDYQAILTVTDSTGKSASAAVTVNVGNTRPRVQLELPPDGGIYEPGDEIRYRVTVADAEDGSVDCSKVTVQEGFGHDSHVHPGLSENGCEGVFKTEGSADHGPEANTYGVISATYTDGGANGGANAPLTGQDIAILQPKLRQAEHFSGRQGVGLTGYDDKSGTKPGGGALVTDMGDGDWIYFDPMSLSRIEVLDLTYSGSPGSGATVELRAGAPDGPVVASVPTDGATQGLYYYETVSGEVTGREADPPGRPLYFVYSGSGQINLDQVRFEGTGVASNAAPKVTSATATPTRGPAPLAVAFSVQAEDPDGDELSYEWDFGDGATSAEQNPTHTYEEPGDYEATVTVADGGGGEATGAVGIVVEAPADETAPTTAVTLEPTEPDGRDGWYTQPVTVTVEAEDEGSGVAGIEYRLDGGEWAAYTGPVTVSTDGEHTLEHRAADNAGNVSEPATVAFRKDAAAPMTSHQVSREDADGDGYSTSAVVTLSATDGGGSGVYGTEYRLNGGAWTAYTGPVTVGAVGEHTVSYRSTDGAGNVEEPKIAAFEVSGDLCPDSDTGETVVVRGVDSRVENRDTGEGCTLEDHVRDEDGWRNKGELKRHVREITGELEREGSISASERRAILKATDRAKLEPGRRGPERPKGKR